MCWNLAISEDEHIIAGIENPKKKKKKKVELEGISYGVFCSYQ